MKIFKVENINSKFKNKELEEIVNTINRDGIIIYPTDTAYAIGVNAESDIATEKLLIYKGQRKNKALSICVANITMIKKYAKINTVANNLIKKYLPGQISIVLEQNSHSPLSKNISKDKSVSIRIPDNAISKTISSTLGLAITASSANISDYPTPFSINQLLKDTPQKKINMIDIIIDAGEIKSNGVSTIVDCQNRMPNILRQGIIEISEF
ncbi:MAG: L-threonylcarbamoyladenylate synthase [Patescibacteria group bacterium]